MKERQRHSKRKEEVLFSLYRYQTHFGSSFSLIFFIALSLFLSRGGFCVFFHNYFAASYLLFVVCDRTSNKKQATGRRKNATGAEGKVRQEKRKRLKTKQKRK
jgi:hypothetical protein